MYLHLFLAIVRQETGSRFPPSPVWTMNAMVNPSKINSEIFISSAKNYFV
jgi:hypothetical protein